MIINLNGLEWNLADLVLPVTCWQVVLVTESLASDSAPSASSEQDGAVSSVGSMDSSPVSSPPVEPVGLRADAQNRATGPPQEVGVDVISLEQHGSTNMQCTMHIECRRRAEIPKVQMRHYIVLRVCCSVPSVFMNNT